MKTFLLDVIPKIQRFSQKLDNLTMLTNQHWVVMDSIGAEKTIYIFKVNNELIVSKNGKVSKGKWEYLGNNSILIDYLDSSYLFKNGFMDKNVLALKVDNKNEYAVFVNENESNGELNSIEKLVEFLESKYIRNDNSLLENDEINSPNLIEEIANSKTTNSEKISSIFKDFKKWLGLLMFIVSILFIIGYINTEMDAIRFHLFNDTSMCLCGPNITQATPIGDLMVLLIFGLIGLFIYIKYK